MSAEMKAADVVKLQEIGREITARVAALDKHGEKSVNLVDSINSLLDQAEVLCGDPEDFAAFKRTYCPKLGQSRTYELLAIKEGRKTLEEIREAGRLRVAKHRASKRDVTEKASVTSTDSPSAPQAETLPLPGPEPEPDKPEPTVPTVEEFKALKAAAKSEAEERRRAAARSHPRNASVDLKLFLNACYHFVPGLNEIELAKAEEIFKQCAKEAKNRAAKAAAA
jgi:hypothetical protein